MADQEQLKILQQGVAAWNEWRKKHPDIQPDLLGTTLRRAYLEEANLRGAILRGANLQNANLGGATLHEADLRGADLTEANLAGAQLLI